MNRPQALSLATLAAVLTASPAARADYAVLRSGLRIHITGYENTGERVRLTVQGGIVEVEARDMVSVEPEDTFQIASLPRAQPTGPFGDLIRAAAERHGLDEKLITRVIAAESNFNPKAVSRKQALGLMQLLPQTAAQYSVGNAFDPAENIEGGTRYLKDLLGKYRGNLQLALAAYNAGPDMVEKYGGVPPFAETQSYVKRILSQLTQK